LKYLANKTKARRISRSKALLSIGIFASTGLPVQVCQSKRSCHSDRSAAERRNPLLYRNVYTAYPMYRIPYGNRKLIRTCVTAWTGVPLIT
jgi:hypothetical protein